MKKKIIKYAAIVILLLLGYWYMVSQGLYENKYVALSVNGDQIGYAEVKEKMEKSQRAADRAKKNNPDITQAELDAVLLTKEEALRVLLEERIMLQEAAKLRIYASEAAAIEAAKADFAQLIDRIQSGTANDEDADTFESIRAYMESKKLPLERYPDIAYKSYQDELTRQNLRQFFRDQFCTDPQKEDAEFAAYIQGLIDRAQVITDE